MERKTNMETSVECLNQGALEKKMWLDEISSSKKNDEYFNTNTV